MISSATLCYPHDHGWLPADLVLELDVLTSDRNSARESQRVGRHALSGNQVDFHKFSKNRRPLAEIEATRCGRSSRLGNRRVLTSLAELCSQQKQLRYRYKSFLSEVCGAEAQLILALPPPRGKDDRD